MDYDLSRSLFSINGRNFSCADFLSALDHYGMLEQWREQTALGSACAAAASAKSMEPEAEVLQKWASEFRYDHNLLSTEECAAWLLSAGFDREDFESHLLRRYWSDKLADEVEDRSKVPNRELFAELYFNDSFQNLIDSWQKRLLAWVDSGRGDFTDLEEIDKNFEDYCSKSLALLDKEAWLKMNQRQLTAVSLSCVPVEKETDITKALSGEKVSSAFPVNGFIADLPGPVTDIIEIDTQEWQGPVSVNDFDILFKVTECNFPDPEDNDVTKFIEEAFFSEVWKTLKVKYVRS